MQTHVDATIRNYLGKQLEAELHSSLKDIEQHGNYFRYTLMPLTDVHLHSDKSYDIEATGDARYVYIFSVIAILVLLIACINFMNLSTARSSNRAKEVGIRKVAGSLRGQLIVQFLVESVLISFFALVLALVICISLLPLFNQVSGKEIHIGALFSSWLLPFVIALVFVVGCVAGSYPAFYLSSFEPIHVLKGAIASGFRKSSLRSMLVIFQFSISITLIIGTMVIYNQLNYIHNRRIGYDRYQVLVLHNTHPMDKQIKAFREEIAKIPGVNNATSSNDLPTASGFDQSAWFREANLDAGKAVITTNFYVDETYIPTLGIEMLKGRNFSPDYPTDSTAVLINEQAVKIFGFKDPMTGTMYSPDAKNNPVQYRVIGVVKDFNFSSMRNKVGPLVFRLYNNPGTIAVRVQSNNIPVLINAIENKWNSMAPGQPFQYTFMDADFDKMYHAEQRMGRLFISFAVFAIFIACLGLLGLVTYAAEQRTKEIGIRKVLGAGVGNIITMLSKDFAKLVLIASVIAFPFAWWIMNKWLQDFAYRINISWWVFLLAGLAAILVALITVSFQAIKAAIMNPVKSLRTE
jgi:putative ABC transport system permease protein